jgi:enoyl-CoA hydratase/carnithine racemase
MTQTVLIEFADGVRTLTLNRPRRLNAINDTLLAELKAALVEGNRHPETRAIILRGSGRAFCAGDDLKEFGQQSGDPVQARRYIESIQEITRQIVLGEKIVIGAIHGWAAGGGFEWAINCDLVIMAQSCRCFFPETSLGVFVTGGVTTILPRLIGLQRTKELILFGEKITAEQALAFGLAWRVVADEVVFDEALAVARRIGALPPRSVRNVKWVLNRACHLDVESAMQLETDATLEGFLDPDTARRARDALA